MRAGSTTVVSFDVTNTAAVGEEIKVEATGLYFKGDAPQFAGTPSPGLEVSPSPSEFYLAPGADQSVDVSLVVAAGVRPGGLYGGVVFEDVPAPVAGKVTVVAAQARPLIGHVPGPVSDAGRILGFRSTGPASQDGPVRFEATFLDTGGIDYEVSGTMTLSEGGSTLGQVEVPPSLVLPGNPRVLPLSFSPPHPLTAGTLIATLRLVWGTEGEHSGVLTAKDVVAASASSSASKSAGAPAGAGSKSEGRSGTSRPLARHGAWPIWAVGGLDLLLLLLAAALLGEIVRRRRHTGQIGVATSALGSLGSTTEGGFQAGISESAAAGDLDHGEAELCDSVSTE